MLRRTSALFVFAIFVLPATARSQAARASMVGQRITIGPFVGMNYSGFYGSDAQDMGSRWDMNIGGKLDIGFGDASFQTGLLYSGRGAAASDQGVDVKFKIRYIELPLLFGYRFPAAGIRPYVIGGGQVAFKTGCKFEGSSGGFSASIDCDDPQIGADFSSTDFGVVGGGGLIYPIGRNDLTFDLRYLLGLSRVEKDSDIKNRGFTFGVGLMIPLAR